MQEFVAIDFETANAQRVSACAVGYAVVKAGKIVESKEYILKPIGGHTEFHSKIHGIKEEHTFDKPEFNVIFPDIQDLFKMPIVAHSRFDSQVINALSNHFDLNIAYDYTDSVAIAKDVLPHLKNHKLKTLVKHFELPTFKHHNAKEDAIACANVFMNLVNHQTTDKGMLEENEIDIFKGCIMGIVADDEVNYKEAYQLLYWLQDSDPLASHFKKLFATLKVFLEDDILDNTEALILRDLLKSAVVL